MKQKTFIILSFLIAVVFTAGDANGAGQANGPAKKTFVYAVKGADTLRLDFYAATGDGARPCVIFAFGGGFKSGQRDSGKYERYYEFLVENGYSVAAIDYRLGLKQLTGKDSEELGLTKLPALFENSIFMAVEDLYHATGFLVANAELLDIDSEAIIASGSSAGAITVLQGEYELNRGSEIAAILPEGFRYAGVISFAGAVFSSSGKPQWNGNAAPVLLFHGDADSNVPYNKLRFFGIGLYGSKYIAGQYRDNRIPYYFYTVENVAHGMAETPMTENLDEIKIFLDRYVAARQPLMTDVVVVPLDRPVVKNKKFGIKDLIRSNFGD